MQQIQKKINELALKKNQLIEQIEIVKKTKENFKKKKSELELLKVKLEGLKEKEDRIIEMEKQKDSLGKDVYMLEKHMKTIEQTISEYSKYDIIFEEKNKEILNAKAKEENYAIKKAELNKEIQF
jgi:hypothetical protein